MGITQGRHGTLIYNEKHFGFQVPLVVEAQLLAKHWQKPSTYGIIPATREDIMMV